MSDFLGKLKEKEDWKDKEVQMKIHTVSQFLPNPLKSQEFLKKFAGHLLSDTVLMNSLDKGQLISECFLDLLKFPKKNKQKLDKFLPWNLESG